MDIRQSQYKPCKDNVVVKVAELSKKTDKGIIIPDSVMEQRAKEKGVNMFLEVIAVGPDTKLIRPGMKVLSVKAPMQLPNVICDEEDYKLAFFPEYTIEGYYES